jgi:Plasmid pRiA4b ORF-3-like protein/Domain of unknown function (DUF1841)
MSPVSRGRKRKKPSTGRTTARSRAARPNAGLDGLEGLYAEMLRAFRPLAKATDPLEVEVFASDLLGAWWKRLPPGEDPEIVFGLGVVDHAARAGTREALALLRALAVVGVTAEQREAASTAAAALAAAGVAEPPWAGQIGRVRVGECWRLADVYGDQASMLMVFDYGRRRHGLVALVDFNRLGGWVKDLFVTPEPVRTLRELRKAALSEPLATLEQVDPAEARGLVEDGLAATDATWEPEVSQELRQCRALALARCRTMPEPDRAREPDREVSEAERDAIVDQFLASLHARGLSDRDAARSCARLLVDFGADYDDGKPLRVSPAKVEGFLLDWVPAKVMLDEEDRDAMPAVVAAWVRWAGERTGLPPAALAELVEVATECGEHFAEAYEEAADASPLRLFLQGLDTSGGLAGMQDAIDRRTFAMPFFGTRLGDEDYPELDPGDEDERRLLIEGEHPEYHAALDDPAFDGEIDGVNPRLHLAIHEVVANQLWNDDPPQAWQAARRLRDAGVDRHEILHRLGGIVTSHLHGALIGPRPVDTGAYRRALDALGQPPSTRPAKRAGRANARGTSKAATTSVGNGVFQVKISLLGARPPIWRRLRLPATTTLGQLHDVIQTAFGWMDSHLHSFEAEGRNYSRPDFGLDEFGDPFADEAQARLGDVVPAVGGRLRYTYDFGDGWEHDLVVEEILPPDSVPHAVCVAGRRAGPPEDCGGVWGYAELLDILADPGHPEHAERLDWLGYRYDPAAFDKDAINRALTDIRLR